MFEELTKEIENKELVKHNLELKIKHISEQEHTSSVKKQDRDFLKETSNTLKYNFLQISYVYLYENFK
jgi:hypothetical protein